MERLVLGLMGKNKAPETDKPDFSPWKVKLAAAGALIAALEAKDANAVVEAFSLLYEACDAEE